ncbi:zinc ABC transporter ATP-binding protein [Brevibacillus reuszeri]|uniref:Zinc ABC transporter ATP-binding protein n=1 Tax=Brevibacillus reuszeri TaxID=54915 RepID=A0A0K9YIA3_9BACL|nr:metal ABC transporter ATP-binding protein [Brevibacillus reuszeri]KNB68409.1 zinc ABC transporter ATP-binding protein [Brevibacillus reuszeri]MED1861089.1 metal ABC transporter ATP-binding protein [Brevibacillus reuszeri]GED72009.1 zinc ABC transporter ATP-binding protein [Brevibacillus reuszeri]
MERITQGMPVVKLTGVSFQYEDKVVLDEVGFTLERGDFVGIVGPNGSGKSTLMKLILGLLSPTKGTVELFGQPLARFREWNRIGYVAQQVAHGAGGFPATVREVVASGLVGKVGLFRRLTARHHESVKNAVERVGLTAKLDQRIGSLSGGQLQRVFIARALVAEPELLILDEPTVGVDQESIEQFYGLLRSLKEENGLTMMIVSHDVGVMTQWVNKVACVQKKIHFHGTAHDFEHNQEKILESMYGGSMKLLSHHH